MNIDKIFYYFEKVLPIIAFYPKWLQYLIIISIMLMVLSLLLGFIYYYSAKSKLNEAQKLNQIAMNISVNNSFTENSIQGYFDAGDSETLYYKTKESDSSIEIYPDMQYLRLLNNGGPIRGLDYWNCPFKWQFPKLDVKITNNTDKTIFFNRAVFEVEKSISDPCPILVIQENPYNTMHFLLVNEGWGNVYNCVINYDIQPKDNNVEFKDTYPYTIKIGDFENSYNVDLSKTLQSLGVDIETLNTEEISELTIYNSLIKKLEKYKNNPNFFGKSKKSREILKSTIEVVRKVIKNISETTNIDKVNKRREAALGPFRDMDVLVFGEIKYRLKTIGGSIKDDFIKFTTLVSLVRPGPGAPIPPSYNYELMLKIDEENYRLDFPISHALRPGDVDRFEILLGFPKSSFHKFKLGLLYNNSNAINSKQISLFGFMPKSQKDYLKTDFEELRRSKNWRM